MDPRCTVHALDPGCTVHAVQPRFHGPAASDGHARRPISTAAPGRRACVGRLRGGGEAGGGGYCLGRGSLARTWDVAVYRLFLFLGITRYRDAYSCYEAEGRKTTNSVHRELVTQLLILRKGDGSVKLKPPGTK